jgi:hypothetical protein
VGTPVEGKLQRLEGAKPNKEYMKIVGSLLYAAIVTRPDIAFAAQMLGRHMKAAEEEHLVAAKRVLRYLAGTQVYSIKYSGNGKSEVYGYSDADWGGDSATMRSTTGYIFFLGNGPISWTSRLQPTIAHSSAEAEYMALCSATQEAIHLRQLMQEMGFSQQGSTKIYEDNQGCIAMSKNPVMHKRTKHIAIRFHFIREKVESGEVEIEYIPTEHQWADALTKGISRTRLRILQPRIMGH